MSANPPVKSHYIHGTEPNEQRRLSQLNEFFNAACLRELGLGQNEKILDVGSGLGQLTRAMARASGAGGRTVAVERSAEQLAEALRLAAAEGEQSLVDFREGDAVDIPLAAHEWGSFDLAHTRFLLEHVPHPQDVVSSMVRSVRPGGRIVLCDDDHELMHLWPQSPGFTTIWQAYIRSYDRLGNDPFIGRRLVSLLERAGARPVRSTWIFFGGCTGQPFFPAIVENAIAILEGARPLILEAGNLDPAEFDEAIRSFSQWSKRPDAAFWYAAAWAEGTKLS